MKKILTVLLITLLVSAFTGCSLFPFITPSTEATQSTTQETTEATTQAYSQKVTTTDEFPTVDDEEENTYTEPGGRWKVTVPEIWEELGEIIESNSNGVDYVRFVYKEAYEDYGAGHVFTIGTANASDPIDVDSLPHGEDIYIDDDIQVFVEYPTDLQYGGEDGSEMSEQMDEYNELKDTTDGIISTLDVL